LIDEKSFVGRSRDGSEGQFSKNWKIPFKSLTVMLLCGIKSSLQREFDSFFKSVLSTDYEIRKVTEGALSQSRRKLKPEAFKAINELACSHFYKGAPYHKWQGHRLLAVAGSRLLLPSHPTVREESGEYFVGRNVSKPVSMALISFLYDPLNLITLDSQISAYSESEHSLALKHLDKLERGDLLLADRGYPGLCLFSLLQSKGVDYCFRMKEDRWLAVRSFMASGQTEMLVEFSLLSKDLKRMKEKGEGEESPIRCRFIAIELGNGLKEGLCRFLTDTEAYPRELFAELYHLRRGVEEGYKLLRERLDLEDFSGKTAKAFKQNFHTQILMMTLCAVLSFPIEEKERMESHREKEAAERTHEKN
jgi:hypothetical protein